MSSLAPLPKRRRRRASSMFEGPARNPAVSSSPPGAEREGERDAIHRGRRTQTAQGLPTEETLQTSGRCLCDERQRGRTPKCAKNGDTTNATLGLNTGAGDGMARVCAARNTELNP